MADRPHESDLKMDNLTRQDLKKIERSMKQPGFMGLLNEYMVQISDPKNKNEYDEYLRQMERERELPKHMKIVEIKPVFCFRTFIVSQKNKKHQMKFFVNMCESEYLERPSCEPTSGENGFTGYNWKIPNSMGKIRYDQDKKSNPCQVVDIAFHKDTFHFAIRKEFKEMIVNIALEAAEKQLGERKETLSRDYVILQNVKCKGVDGKPALMPIRYIEGKVYNKGEGPTNEPERDLEGRETKLQKEINKQKEEFDKDKQKDKPKEEEKPEEQPEETKPLVVDLESGVQRPKYSTILTYPIDYSEFIDSPYTNRKKVPNAFNLQLQIPRVESMQEIAGQTLQINEKRIVLQIAEKYFIDLEWQDLKLKYSLLTANAKAKYDKKKKCLRITIPIDQSVKYETQVEVQPKLVQPVEQSQAVLQNQTWKNKVLEFTDPSVSVKVLQQNEEKEEQKPALVQEIDEEDIVEEVKESAQTKVIKTEEEEEQNQTRPVQKFTLGSYYNKDKKINKNVEESPRLGHVFQETADKVVIVFQLKNYKKEEVRCIATTTEILLEWNPNNTTKYEHLTIAEPLSQAILKVEVVYRVGFVAVMLQKGEKGKGKYFQKESLVEVQHQGESYQEQIAKFTAYLDFVQQQKEESEKQARVQREAIQAAAKSKENKENGEPKPKPNSEQQQAEQKQIEQQITQKNSLEATPKREQPYTLTKQKLGRTLQPQFIEFRLNFVQKLD